MLFFLGRYEESIIYYDKCIQIDSKYAEAYYNKAISLAALDKFDEVVINLERAIMLNDIYRKEALKEKLFHKICF